jgi:hypothetical protein
MFVIADSGTGEVINSDVGSSAFREPVYGAVTSRGSKAAQAVRRSLRMAHQ